MSDDLVMRLQTHGDVLRHIEAQTAEIARLRVDRNAEISARIKAEGEFSTMQRRIARQRRALAKLYQRRHDKNAEIARLRDRVARLEGALEKLARLGAEPYYGNSDGNLIAHAALAGGKDE